MLNIVTSRIDVLIVEDDPVYLELYCSKLERYGRAVRVVYAKDGYDALGGLIHTNLGLVILDLEMPRFDGLEFLSIMKSKAEFAPIPVWVISSTAERGSSLVDSMDHVHCFSKPIRSDLLDHLLALQLGSRPAAGEPAPASDCRSGLIDFDSMQSYLGKDYRIQRAVAAQFCALAAERLACLHIHGSNLDFPALRKTVHVLRGSTSMLGAQRAHDAVLTLSHHLQSHSAGQVVAALALLVNELRTLTLELVKLYRIDDF